MQEFKDRRLYDINRSVLRHSHKQDAETAEAAKTEEPAKDNTGTEENLLLFATRTCPNCKKACELLDAAGIPYTKLLAEENAEQVARYQIRQAPTLIYTQGKSDFRKIVGVGAVIQFIQEKKA